MATISEKINAFKLPTRSVVFLLICVAGIMAFGLLVIYPYHISLNDADVQIKQLKSRIEEQKVLYPVFQDLLRKARLKETRGLPFPEKTKLAREDTAKISAVFHEMAKKSHMQLVDIKPEVGSLVENTGYLKLNLDLKGEFFNLRDFLILMEALPYLEHIEQVQIRAAKESKAIRLKIWLAQE
jgi:hypothetical protein